MSRYQLSEAWHVLDTHDCEDGVPRELAAATSKEAGEKIVRALNAHEGAVAENARLRAALTEVAEFGDPGSRRIALRALGVRPSIGSGGQ